MNNEEIIFTVEDINITTVELLEDVINDKRLGVAFAIDPSQTDTNYWKDPYVKFYPDSSNRTKGDNVYRVYLKRAAYTIHNDSLGKKTPKNMNSKDRDLLIDGMEALRLPNEYQLKIKHKDLDNPDLIQTYEALCQHVDKIAHDRGIHDYENISGGEMPNYKKIKLEEQLSVIINSNMKIQEKPLKEILFLHGLS